MDKIDYSIVVPVYCNEDTIRKLYDELLNKVILANNNLNCEIIFVDDGSDDGSFAEILQLKKSNNQLIKIIKLTRNFGQVAAINAGYRHARGDCIINISADLQDPPELINEMLRYRNNDNYEIVICHRKSRDESLFRKVTSEIFYKIIKKLSFSNMPIGGFDFALISDKIKNIILLNQESNPFWQGQILWTGYKIQFIPYNRIKRELGNSKWTLGKKIKYLIDGILGYSYFPLRIMTVIGFIISVLGFAYAIAIFIAKIAGTLNIEGWAPIMIIILIVSGIQMMMLGIIGEYLWRIQDQVRGRPLYIIESIYD